MKELTRWALMALMTVSLAACVGGGRSSDGDDGFAAEADSFDGGGATASADDEFSDFDDAPTPAPSAGQASNDDLSLDSNDDFNLDDEAPAAPSGSGNVANNADDLNVDDLELSPSADLPPEPAPADTASTPEPEYQEPPVVSTEPAAPSDPAPSYDSEPAPPVAASSSAGSLSTITSVRYRANDTGGTVLIEANGPISYTTRTNPELKQMIVEIPESILPKRLQRPLNTRDIQGTIGAIDSYQNSGSNVSRFVIQLRDGSPDPVVQQEGNTVLIVANSNLEDEQASLVRGDSQVNADLNSGQVLASHSLDDYLSNNTKFYGKKISIEVNNMDVGDAFRFITEESGVNMVLAEDVKGTVSLKLRQVPWDQALVVLMKAKGLGYTRQGNVLRIAPLEQLRKEEDDATKIAMSRKSVEPLKVRVFSVSYAQVADLEKKVQSFSSERGKVVVDVRTNSVIVTDMEDNLTRVGQLIQSLDIQPSQVLIEGRIVEAKESFLRRVGVNWGMNGGAFQVSNGQRGPVNLRPTLGINPITSAAGNAFSLGLTLGTLDNLGNLSATLALNEQEDRVKIISSPRVVTMSNEQAKMSQTTEVPVKQVTQNGATTETTFTFKPLALLLDVTPQITSDASVIMKVIVKREFPGARDAESGEFPVNSREANTRVLVKNGETAVIGGIYQSDETSGETGVPWLRDIPVVGSLFRARATTREKTELLVFLTPRILSPNDRGNGSGPAL